MAAGRDEAASGFGEKRADQGVKEEAEVDIETVEEINH